MKTKLTQRPRLPISGSERPVLVVGDETARGIANRLADSTPVEFATADATIAAGARSVGIETHTVDVTKAADLAAVTRDIDVGVVAAGQDRTTLLVAQLLRTRCEVDHVVAGVADERHTEAFAAADITPVRLDAVLAEAVSDVLDTDR